MATLRYTARRLLAMVPSLLGITLVTFLLMDLAPASRAELHSGALATEAGPGRDTDARTMHLLREHWGMIDPATGVPYPVWQRYLHWLGRAVTLDFAGPGESQDAFHGRIAAALPVTLLINTLALVLALAVAIPLGSALGMTAGSLFDRLVSAAMFLVYGVPEFLLATLLVLALGGVWAAPFLPVRGLTSDGASSWPAFEQAWDMAMHLLLPVVVLATPPCVVVTRFLRDSVRSAARSDYVLAMRGWGLSEREVRRHTLRNGLSPAVTLLGVLLPTLVSGSVVVENVFALPGLGRLAFDAVRRQEYPMVMALTLLVSIVTLLSLLLSDLLHRAVDPRVQLR